MAFNAKNLSYDRQEPAFLRKLRGESGGVDSVRHERPMQRPRKPKNKEDEDEDAPTYVDEETNATLTKEEYEALIGGGKDTPKSPNTHDDGDTKPGDSEGTALNSEQTNTTEAPKAQEKIVEIGGQKRKKQARVVGGDDEVAPAEDEAPRKDSSSSRKPKGKKKKVKLSFDDA